MPNIDFHSENVPFKLKQKAKVRLWLETVVKSHGGSIGFLQYIFCDDAHLLSVNQQYLQHDTLTDIITFRYQEHPEPIESDIYISTERVQENAEKYGVSFENELHRVMIHGVLHLLGLKDKTAEQKSKMREAEERSLSLFV